LNRCYHKEERMLIQSSFWICMGVSAAAAFVGTIIAVFASMIGNEQRTSNKKDHQDKDITITGVCMLVIAAVVIVLALPISHWFEICVVSAGLSGLALRWPTVSLADYTFKKVRKSREWIGFVVLFTTPPLIISLLVSIVNHYWWKLF